MIAEKKSNLKSCRSKIKDKLKTRLHAHAPIHLRKFFQDKENFSDNEDFFNHFHTLYKVLHKPIVIPPDRNIKRKLLLDYQHQLAARSVIASSRHKRSVNQSGTFCKRSTPRQNLTDRYQVQSLKGRSRTLSKNKSSGKLFTGKSTKGLRKSHILRI